MSERQRAVVERLDSACYVGVDRSEKMVEAATQRNREFVDAGVAEFLQTDLEDLELGERRFDKIFAVRVGRFYRDPDRARAIVEQWLAPAGSIVTVFDEP